MKKNCDDYKVIAHFISSIDSLIGSYGKSLLSIDEFVYRLLLVIKRYYFDKTDKYLLICKKISETEVKFDQF